MSRIAGAVRKRLRFNCWKAGTLTKIGGAAELRDEPGRPKARTQCPSCERWLTVGDATQDAVKDGEDFESTVAALKPFPRDYEVVYVENEADANRALANIEGGKVGFDTEFTERRPTREERMIGLRLGKGTAQRKAAILGWQIVELGSNKVFPVAWDNIGLRLIQITRDQTVWVLDMWKIRAIPKHLKRILESPSIEKTGAGLPKDIRVIWDDLRMDLRNLVDVGMMAKLLLAERYPNMAYGNLALKTSVEDVLGFELKKELSASDWAAPQLTEEQVEYAALDSVASLKLFEVLEPALRQKEREIGQIIPAAWYRFNSRSGEPMRLKLSAEGMEIQWRTSDCTWYSGGKFQGYP